MTEATIEEKVVRQPTGPTVPAIIINGTTTPAGFPDYVSMHWEYMSVCEIPEVIAQNALTH